MHTRHPLQLGADGRLEKAREVAMDADAARDLPASVPCSLTASPFPSGRPACCLAQPAQASSLLAFPFSIITIKNMIILQV